MMTEKNMDSGRRRFLTTALPLGTIACLGCKGLLALPGFDGRPFTSGQASKFAENPGMTAEETFRFFYGLFVPALVNLAKSVGREKLVRELTKVSAENAAQMIAAAAKDMPKRDMKAFAGLIETMMATAPSNKAFAYEIVENSEKVNEAKFTQCLPAKIWREMNAADLGYALECSPVDAMAKAFNPKMKGAVLKTLMKGDSYCLVRFELV
jgi:hypothetical protein